MRINIKYTWSRACRARMRSCVARRSCHTYVHDTLTRSTYTLASAALFSQQELMAQQAQQAIMQMHMA